MERNLIAVSKFSIKDIETITGIKAHTLRVWEQRYNFLTPKRTDTKIRYYDDDDLRFILNISILNNHGIKISEIAKMSYQKIQEMVLLVSEKDSQYENQVKALISSMFSLDENAFNKILTSCILKLGLESTMTEIVFPFLHQIGIMWLTGSVHPAHEHFITNLIRQKLYVAIDAQTGKINGEGKRFLLFLPEGEPHEIGLLFANYMLRSRGHQVIYLGQNLPHEDLKNVFDFYEPEYVFTTVTSAFAEEDIQAFLDHLQESWPKANIWVTGSQVVCREDLKIPSNLSVIKNVPDMASMINKIPQSVQV